MKILPIPPQTSINKFKRAQGATAFNEPLSRNDEVQISESAQSFGAIYKAVQNEIANASPEYQAKVQDISQRIADGSYHVSGEDVAQKMLDGILF